MAIDSQNKAVLFKNTGVKASLKSSNHDIVNTYYFSELLAKLW